MKDVLNIIRHLPGSWRLPITERDSIIITFSPNGNFFWVVSANSVIEKVKQIAVGPHWQGNWQVRSEPGSRGSLRGSANAVKSSSASLGSLFGRSSSSNIQKPPPGPYLILNFTDIPKSILNVSVFGVRLDLANWTNNFLETMRNGNYRILKFDTDQMQLETPKGKREMWHRATTVVIMEE